MLKCKNTVYRMIIWLVFLIGAVVFFNIFVDIIKYAMILRVPLLSGLLLITLPFIAFYKLPNILENLFILENSTRLAVVIVVSTLVGLGIAFIWLVIYLNAGCRFLGEDCVNSSTQLNVHSIVPYLWGVIMGLPVAFTSVRLSSNLPVRDKLIGGIVGAVIACLLMYTIYSIRLDDTNTVLSLLERLLLAGLKLIMPESAQVGFINHQTGELSTGHLLILNFALVTVIFYVIGYFLYQPSVEKGSFLKGRRRWQAPALYQLLVLILALTFVFALLTFVFDYFRVPTLLIALAISWGAYAYFKTDHFFKLIPLSHAKPTSSVLKALQNRLAINNNDGTLVVICASGGGIQAAGWTTKVLTELQLLLGQPFANAIGLISSVSGGSVGAMHYLDITSANANPNSQQLKRIFDNSTKNSLDAMAWGLAYPDLWRLIGAPFLSSQLNDRGTAIETDWKTVMQNSNAKLSDWQTTMQVGKLPITVFNATQVETGRRLLLCPISFTKCNDYQQIDFNSLYKKSDMDVTTAARLSATFAYISPIARGNNDVHSFHCADGGYFDNYGVFTANQWLDKEVLPIAKEIGIKRIMFIEIKAFPAAPNTAAKKLKAKGWKMSFLGPWLTLANVRNATQDVRNEYDVDIMSACQSQAVDFKHYTLEFPKQIVFYETKPFAQDQDEDQDQTKMKKILNKAATMLSKKDYTPPLSWKLSEKQKHAITKGWDTINTKNKADSSQDLQELISTWQQWYS